MSVFPVLAKLPSRVQIVPKIESEIGVKNIVEICEAGKSKYIMLDQEDLYTDVKADASKFNQLVYKARKICKQNNVNIFANTVQILRATS